MEVNLVKQYKIEKVEDFKNIFKNYQSLIFADHSGLKAENMYYIRTKLSETEANLKILKNTLALRAASQVYEEIDFSEIFKGPTSMVVCKKDAASVAKLLKSLMKEFETLKIKGGLFEGKIYGPEGVERLATLPTKDVLLAQLLGLLNNPIVGLVTVLSALPRNLAVVLDAVRQKKEKELELHS